MCITLKFKILVESFFFILFFLVKLFCVHILCGLAQNWLILQIFAYRSEQKVSPSKLSVLSNSLMFSESLECGSQGCCGPIHLHCQFDKSDATALLACSHVKQSNSLCFFHHPSKCQLCHVALMNKVNSLSLPHVFRDLLFMQAVQASANWGDGRLH